MKQVLGGPRFPPRQARLIRLRLEGDLIHLQIGQVIAGLLDLVVAHLVTLDALVVKPLAIIQILLPRNHWRLVSWALPWSLQLSLSYTHISRLPLLTIPRSTAVPGTLWHRAPKGEPLLRLLPVGAAVGPHRVRVALALLLGHGGAVQPLVHGLWRPRHQTALLFDDLAGGVADGRSVFLVFGVLVEPLVDLVSPALVVLGERVSVLGI